jgi:pimeloyl-ACP methyl ester carboxylesterase
MRWRSAAVLVALLSGGCGSTHSTATSVTQAAHAPSTTVDCVRNGHGTHVVVTGGTRVAVSGRGRIGVALLPQSGGDACEWTGFVRAATARGLRTAQIDWNGDFVPETLDAIAALRRSGARKVALVGASLGGHFALVVAARHDPRVDAVVTLSAERTERSDARDAAHAARRIRIPALTIGSRNDGWTTFGADTRAIHRAIPAPVNTMLLVPGAAHGVDLLSPPMTAAIVRFLRRRS